MTETVNGDTKTYTYTYDDDNRVTSMTVDGVTVTYTYDGFGRLTQKQTANGTQTVRTDSLTYRTVGNATTSQVSAYNGTTYTYDDNGNILTVTDSSGTVRYTYDTANQLITETNEAKEYHNVWTYDDAGNILARMECEYIDGVVESIDDQYNYTYGDSQWGDLLTVYDGQTLTYDAIGNLTGDGQWTYTWKHGRQLTSMTRGSTTWTFTYDANGMRIGKVCNNGYLYEYVYDGSRLVQINMETSGDYVVEFTYDAMGTPLTITVNGILHYYITNLQGDVTGIQNQSGNQVITYQYDAWGNVSMTGNDPIGEFNPLLYRGYVYDFETGLYYLQSRYYNPRTGRFINADNYAATGQGLLGNNMFAYCGNGPVNKLDPAGTMFIGILGGNPEGFISAGSGSGMNYYPHNHSSGTSGSWGRKIKKSLTEMKDFLFCDDAKAVAEAKGLAFYKGVPVVKLPIGRNAFSFGIIFLGDEVKERRDVNNLLKHESGHTLHMAIAGIPSYTVTAFVPSVLGFHFRDDIYEKNYYSYVYEYTADVLGGVDRGSYSPLTESLWGLYFAFTIMISP